MEVREVIAVTANVTATEIAQALGLEIPEDAIVTASGSSENITITIRRMRRVQ